MRKKVYIVFLFLILVLHPFLYGQNVEYQMFDNISMENKFSSVCCFTQDSKGLVWIGSEKGLFSYDGYALQQHFTLGTSTNTRIYSGILVNNKYLYLGSDNGILIYNCVTDKYEKTPSILPTDVRALSLSGQKLWIGTLNGLYIYDLLDHKVQRLDSKRYKQLPNSTVYSILKTHEGDMYIGTYNGLCYYSASHKSFFRIPLTQPHCNNIFVNSLLEDNTRKCIWVGTEGALYRYDKLSHRIEEITQLSGNSMKSLALDGNGNLLIGTDNGLYVYTEHAPLQHILHDARNIHSLANNIIWSIFADRNQNIWIGTDYGISLFRYNKAFQYIPLPHITGVGDGNHFYSVFRDTHGYLWLGGTDGLLRVNDPLSAKVSVRWYRVGDPQSSLPHNRIRHIYEDSSHNLWVASDGGLNRYDYASEQFMRYNIVDSTNTLNSNWVYYVMEDDSGKLWIATCLGGIFVVDKTKLLESKGYNYVADENISTRNGLSGMFVNQIVSDARKNKWVLLYNVGVDKIDALTHKVHHIQLEGIRPNYIIRDHYGFIWIGYSGGVLRVSPYNNQIHRVSFSGDNYNEVLSMLDVNGKMWISTSDGLWVVDERTFDTHKVNISNQRFTSLYYDSAMQRIYMGGVDGIGVLELNFLSKNMSENPIMLTALYVNGSLYNPSDKLSAGVRYTDRIELSYKQNNLSFEFSDLPYSFEEKNRFIYQLQGVDNEWVTLKTNTNKISYNNLDPGSYKLVICRLGDNGKPTRVCYSLDVKIDSPWYNNAFAKTIYILMFLTLIIWIINFMRMKTRLKMERTEKEHIMEQVKLKIDFWNKLDKARDNVVELNRLINQVAGAEPKKEKTRKQELKSSDEKLLVDITEIIESKMSDSELNVNALCELQGISNKQLYRKIKQLTGVTPVEYIKSIRMKRAARLLEQRKFTVAEVMYMVGFSNHSYFSKCFLTEYGKTPKQFMEDA